MRLFLSSQDFGNYQGRLVELVGPNRRVVFINNAKDEWGPREKKKSAAEKEQEFNAAGFDFEEIDLRDYFKKSSELLNKLSSIGLIWLSGGNTFILRRAMSYSGLDRLLVNLLKEDKLAYGGSSAGSIIPTPSLHGTEYGDNPNSVPEGYKHEIIWDGLNLVPFYIVPHCQSDWFNSEADEMLNYLRKNDLPHYALIDGQVVVIDGDKTEFLK